MTPKYKKLNPGTTSLEPEEFARTWEIVRLIVLPGKRHFNNLFVKLLSLVKFFKIIARKSFLNLFLQGKKLC